ncbi:hypothetical protein [Mastigocoleus testarum]|uniref:Uncharacterized protein n=1 Tax=Mastigocoleus testarum BC008 TaxID=371196 RepID=A0A0V7ZVV3_9CYAN|nr:hypothetical protein [Mastigocoleus testarum]KST68587.1 hypothetical protein BC008_33590 [Mastigocoleus testarum BC008]
MLKDTLYPFLFSRNQQSDYKIVLGPHFIWDEDLLHVIADTIGEEEPTAKGQVIHRQLRKNRIGNLMLIFRVVYAVCKDISMLSNEYLRDSQGRKILHAEGFIVKSKKLDVDSQELLNDYFHNISMKYYKKFWELGTIKKYATPKDLGMHDFEGGKITNSSNKLGGILNLLYDLFLSFLGIIKSVIFYLRHWISSIKLLGKSKKSKYPLSSLVSKPSRKSTVGTAIVNLLGYKHLIVLEGFVKKFQKHYGDNPNKLIFLMMKFPDSKNTSRTDLILRDMYNTIKKIGENFDLQVIRSDEFSATPVTWDNAKVHAISCSYGIAILGCEHSDELNLKIAMEASYMEGLGKQVLLLIEEDLIRKHSVYIQGHTYDSFSWENRRLRKSIEESITKWLRSLHIPKV